MDILLNAFCWINTWPNRIMFRQDTAAFVVFIYEKAPIVLNVSTFLSIAFFHIQSSSSILVCFHRLTTAVFMKSNDFWNKWYLLVYIIVILYSCCVAKLIILPKIYYDYDLLIFVEPSLPHEDGVRDGIIIMCFIFFYLLTIMTVGAVTIYQVRKRLSQVLDQHAGLLRRMSKIAIANNCVYALLVLWEITLSMELKSKMEFVLTASDIMSFSLTYILLFLDSNVRVALKNSVTTVPFSRIARVSNSDDRRNTIIT